MSNLEFAFLPRAPKLKNVFATNNNITAVEARSFVENPQLRVLDLYRNKIQLLHPEAFFGLASLIRLELQLNEISALDRRIFTQMPNMVWVDLRENNLTVLTDIFSGNRKLVNLFLDNNQIEAVSPRLLSHLRGQGVLKYTNLYFKGNPCIDFSSRLYTDSSWMEANAVLKPCFNAYLNVTAETPKRVVFEFHGNLELFDRRNGNPIIAL